MNPSKPSEPVPTGWTGSQPPDQRERALDGLDRFTPNPSNPSRNTPQNGYADPMHVSGGPRSQCAREPATPGNTVPVVGPAWWAMRPPTREHPVTTDRTR